MTQADSSAAGQTSFTQHGDKRGAAHTFETRQVDSDIGQTEAWSANMKRMYDDYAHLAQRVHGDGIQANSNMQHIFETDFAARLADERVAMKAYFNSVSNQMGNLTDEQKRNMAQETRHVDLAVDRQWNVDEQGNQVALIMREFLATGVFERADMVAMMKALIDGVTAKSAQE